MKNIKKIVALCLVFALFVSTNAFASQMLPFFEKTYTQYEQAVSYGAKLNKSITVTEEFEDGEYISKFVDVIGLIESLFNSTSDTVVKASLSDDFLSGKMSVEGTTNIPFKINRNLKLTADSSVGVWIEYDFTDLENPKFDIIENHPFFDKYVTISLYDLFNGNKEIETIFTQVMAHILNKETMSLYNSTYAYLLEKNAKIDKNGLNYTISIDNEALKGLVNDSVLYFVNYIKTYMTDNGYCTKEEFDAVYASEVEPALNEVSNVLANVNVLGDEGLVLKYKTDRNDYIEQAEVSANIKFNVFDITDLFTGAVGEYKNRDNGIIDFTLNAKTEITSVGKKINVEFPEITVENAVDFKEMFMSNMAAPETESADDCWHYDYYYTTVSGLPVVKDGVYYAPLRVIATELGFAEYDITYDNGMISIARPEWVKCGKYSKAVFTIGDGDNNVYLDGEQYALENAVLEFDGTTYVAADFAKIVFNIPEFDEYVYFDLVNQAYELSFRAKYCEHTEKEIYGEW